MLVIIHDRLEYRRWEGFYAQDGIRRPGHQTWGTMAYYQDVLSGRDFWHATFLISEDAFGACLYLRMRIWFGDEGHPGEHWRKVEMNKRSGINYLFLMLIFVDVMTLPI